MDKVNNELFLSKLNEVIELLPNDNDEVLFLLIDLKSEFMDLYMSEDY